MNWGRIFGGTSPKEELDTALKIQYSIGEAGKWETPSPMVMAPPFSPPPPASNTNGLVEWWTRSNSLTLRGAAG